MRGSLLGGTVQYSEVLTWFEVIFIGSLLGFLEVWDVVEGCVIFGARTTWVLPVTGGLL